MSKLKKRDLERKGEKKQKLLEDKLIEEHLEELKNIEEETEEIKEEV